MKESTDGKRWASILFQIALFVTGAYLMWHAWAGPVTARPVSYSEFIENIRQGRIEAVQISAAELRGRLRQEAAGAAQSGGHPRPLPQLISAVRPPEIPDPEFLPLLREKGVEVVGRVETEGRFGQLLISAFPILLLIGFWLWTFRGMSAHGAEALNFGRNRAKIYDRSSKERVTFADVTGVEEVESELVEVVDFLKNPQKYQRLGGRTPVVAALERETGKRIRPEWRIDHDLMGGVRPEVGSMVFDGSVRARLERLRERLAAGPVPERALARA